ncbi:MAG TPA: antibiotic biosynthesis monooxygenase family protein [Micromonosporaceae bacterium]|nr:antibiotic biosynthesis monooxygenase family protein [Micromonosporaceae bacterium]
MFDLIVIVTVTNSAEVSTVAAAFEQMRPMCLAEPGCVSWHAYHSNSDPQRFVLVERWESQQAWEAHGDLDAIQKVYLPIILPRITREVHGSKRLGEADRQVTA